MKNKLLCIILSCVCLLACLAGCGKTNSSSKPYGTHHAVITIKNYGQVHLELDGDTAPITVKNFVELAKEGFYDGLTIHRIVEDFVVQGGDPDGNGSGGSGKAITGEFSANGIENNITHERGVISMARLGNDYNSATSQFFIVLDDDAKSSLDGLYAAFGKVTEGMDIIDEIVDDTPIANPYSGLVDKSRQPIIESIVITD